MTSLADRAAMLATTAKYWALDPEIRTLIEDLVAAKERAEADADRLANHMRNVYPHIIGPSSMRIKEALRLHDEAVAQR